MPVTATSVAAATTMLAAVGAVFLTFVLCFYIFLCAKRYRGAAPTVGGASSRLRFVFGGGGSAAAAAAWCHNGGVDEESMAALPRKEVAKGEAMDCAVCITELAAGETARVLPRCGHGFHVDCVDMWLRSHSTCPLCRCPVVDEPLPPAAVQPPEVDPESPNFPTNVLFFGSQDDVSTGGAPPPPPPVTAPPRAPTPPAPPVAGVAAVVEAARVRALRRLLGCRGAAPPPPPPQQAETDIEMGLAGGESSAAPPVKS